jgi:mannose-6-phosphate isomerase-like protein (cupin superfamily)
MPTLDIRRPFKKTVADIPVEAAHDGQGSRQVLLSDVDPISTRLRAMTKGYLAPGAAFDWHDHKQVDELFLVTQGEGSIAYANGDAFTLKTGDLVYSPSDIAHRIENTGDVIMEFYFVRIDA